MEWRHYEARQSGDCEVVTRHEIESMRYDIGIVETGRSRVFAGHFVRLTLNDGKQITGEDAASLRGALWRLARNVTALDLRIDCVGLNADWNESGLSVDSGWGYWGHLNEPMHMMSPLPTGDDLDDLIEEAVAGMRLGINITLEPGVDTTANAAPRRATKPRTAPSNRNSASNRSSRSQDNGSRQK